MKDNYIEINDILFKVNLEDISDLNALKIGEGYIENDIVYIFRGDYEENISEQVPGLYINQEGIYIIVEYPEGESVSSESIVFKELSRMETLKNNMKKIKLNNENPIINRKSDKAKRKSSELDKEKNSEVLVYDIEDENDDIVRLIKETVNEKEITYAYIYSRCSSNNEGYNLIYGLRTRNSISFSSANKWANILDMELQIVLVEKK